MYYLQSIAIRKDADVLYKLAVCCSEVHQFKEGKKWALACAQQGGDKKKLVLTFLASYYSNVEQNKAISLRYYMQYSQQTESLNTDLVWTNLLSKLHQTRLQSVIFSYESRLERNLKNSIKLIQVARLYDKIGFSCASRKMLEVVNQMVERSSSYVPQVVVEELLVIFGSPEDGIYPEKDRHKLLTYIN